MLAARDRGDLLALRTSGTTGGARSVVRTTASWFDSFGHVTDLLALDQSSRVWVAGPLSATMNLFATVHAAAVGARVQSTPAGATHAVLTPTALTRALAHDVRLSGVHVLVAGDRLGRALHDEALAEGVGRVSHYYGAAELSFVAWGSHAEDLTPFPGVDVECRDGVVWVRSPYLCLRYDGPDGPLTWNPDGFATVGDRGAFEAGRLRVHGRGDDTVVTAGATVVVADVEAALEAATSHAVTVLGLPHPDLGEVLCAVVRTREHVQSLKAAGRHLLDPAHRPRRWFEAPTPPLTPAGKLDRERLRSMLQSGGVGARV